jgi:transposase
VGAEVGRSGLTEDEKTAIWDWTRQGVSMRTVAARLGRSTSTVRKRVAATGGDRVDPTRAPPRPAGPVDQPDPAPARNRLTHA